LGQRLRQLVMDHHRQAVERTRGAPWCDGTGRRTRA
jgi:hypothetical protein